MLGRPHGTGVHGTAGVVGVAGGAEGSWSHCSWKHTAWPGQGGCSCRKNRQGGGGSRRARASNPQTAGPRGKRRGSADPEVQVWGAAGQSGPRVPVLSEDSSPGQVGQGAECAHQGGMEDVSGEPGRLWSHLKTKHLVPFCEVSCCTSQSVTICRCQKLLNCPVAAFPGHPSPRRPAP